MSFSRKNHHAAAFGEGGSYTDEGETDKPWAALYAGYLLIFMEAALLLCWFVWEENKFAKHELVNSTEALLAAPHFVVLLSLCTLLSDLNRACKSGKCKKVHTTFAWMAPTVVAATFDILSLQRAMLFFPDDTQLYIIDVFGLVNSSLASLWCLWVVFQLKGFLNAAE
jgi:hypothetical protein